MTIRELVQMALSLGTQGESDAGGMLMLLANARIAGKEAELQAQLEEFMTTHVMPVIEQRTPGSKEKYARQLLEEFGPDDPRAARIARALRGHG